MNINRGDLTDFSLTGTPQFEIQTEFGHVEHASANKPFNLQ